VTTKKTGSEANLDANAPDGVALTDAEKSKAMHEGAVEDAKKTGEAIHHNLTDGSLPGDPPKRQWHGYDEIQQWAHNLDLGIDAFEAVIGAGADEDQFVPDEKVYGLLALERNGRNRTPYVKAAMKRLKLKADELPGGGPGYTNDLTNITDL
jgi:hypothetical protein